MHKHTFYYFLGNKKYPEIYILCVDDLATDVDGEDKERRVVINMVVEEDDGRCKVLLASGLWSILISFLCWCWHSCSEKFTGH